MRIAGINPFSINKKKKIPVTLFIGEKNFVQRGRGDTKTGYKRHYESEFFSNLKKEVDFDIKYLYPWKGRRYSAFRHLTNHFMHPFLFRKEFKKDRIKHIMFAEEAFMLNFLPAKKTVVSCLDVIPLVLPGETSAKYRKFLKLAFKGMKKADKILANSYYTKSDIVKHLGIDEKKIHVAYPPIRRIFKPLNRIPDEFYAKYNVDKKKKYLLYVGALDLPRKNLKTVLESFKLINREYKAVNLLLVGYTTLKGKMEELKGRIDELNLTGTVKIITDVPDDDLVAFYNLAEIFLFPSLYEGFGLPPLEAMACKTPVIASHVASMPEVLGNAALYADPLCHEEIARQAEMLFFNEDLRHELVEAGVSRAEKYSWGAYCNETLKLYKELV
jgi:glycosyltransferase involved in cell wall biosynthesis